MAEAANSGSNDYAIPELMAVAMARTSDPNSAGSQFYICLDAIPSLDNQYTVFGQVTKGFETVKKIEKGDKILRIRIVPRTP